MGSDVLDYGGVDIYDEYHLCEFYEIPVLLSATNRDLKLRNFGVGCDSTYFAAKFLQLPVITGTQKVVIFVVQHMQITVI